MPLSCRTAGHRLIHLLTRILGRRYPPLVAGQTSAGGGYGGRVPEVGTSSVEGVAGLLLTGGASRRMGTDKASIRVDGVPLAARTAAVLGRVVSPVLEVGPGRSGLTAVLEDPPGCGPLAAVAAGAGALASLGHAGPALVVATDLPRLGVRCLRQLAAHPGTESVVPVVAGRPQWLVARWSAAALALAPALVRAGERGVRALGRVEVAWLDEPEWADELLDVDTHADLARAGLAL